MPCEECRDLTTHLFRCVDDLVNAVRLASEEVERGVLSREAARGRSAAEQEAVDSSLASGALPNRVHYRFRCEVCGDRFTLSADASSGEGGWTREGDDVPSPVDLTSPEDAAEWEETAMRKRPWRTEFFERIAREVEQAPGPVKILELGSGPGFLAQHLLSRLPGATMDLLDHSNAMHALARDRLGDLASRANFVSASFKEPDWPDRLGPYDFVVTHQAVHELRHKRHAAALHRQVRSVLKAGGAYFMGDHYCGPGGMANDPLYMSLEEMPAALREAGFAQVAELLRKGGLVLFRAA
jgi:SAM-dependent methyltransferase